MQNTTCPFLLSKMFWDFISPCTISMEWRYCMALNKSIAKWSRFVQESSLLLRTKSCKFSGFSMFKTRPVEPVDHLACPRHLLILGWSQCFVILVSLTTLQNKHKLGACVRACVLLHLRTCYPVSLTYFLCNLAWVAGLILLECTRFKATTPPFSSLYW